MPSRTLVIGDIHGCLTQLDALLASTAPTTDDHLIVLGDVIDRGPDSAGVIKRLLQLSQSHRLTCLIGNHEQMMVAATDSRAKFDDWCLNGGDATLRSYGGSRGKLRDVPQEHWSFLQKQLVSYVETDTHLFVHANAYPDMPLSEQPDYMLRWERFDSICPHTSGKVIVCGHTPQKSGMPRNRGFAICLDTYAFGGGMLTCMDSTSGRIWQADKRGQVTRAHITDFEDE